MEKRIVIDVKNCNDCPNLDHSGFWAEGGSKQICGHNNACSVRANTHKNEKYHWIHRVLRNKNKAGKLVIPNWCPL